MKRSLSPTCANLLDPADELPQGATPFERAHHYGSRRHTAHWLRANEAAIDVARITSTGLDYTSEPLKTLLSRVVLRVLDVALNEDGKTGRI